MKLKRKLRSAIFTIAALATLCSSAYGLEQKINQIALVPLRTAHKVENIREKVPAVYWTEADIEALPDPSFMNSGFIRAINSDLRRDHSTQYIVFIQGTGRNDFLGHVQDMNEILAAGYMKIGYFTGTEGFAYQGIAEMATRAMEDSTYLEDSSEPAHHTLFPPLYYFSRALSKSRVTKKEPDFLKDYNEYNAELSGLIKELGFDLYIPQELGLVEENSDTLFSKPVRSSIIYTPQKPGDKRIKGMPYVLIKNPSELKRLRDMGYEGTVFKVNN